MLRTPVHERARANGCGTSLLTSTIDVDGAQDFALNRPPGLAVNWKDKRVVIAPAIPPLGVGEREVPVAQPPHCQPVEPYSNIYKFDLQLSFPMCS